MSESHWLDDVFTPGRALAIGETAPETPEAWLRALFPAHVKYPFAERHEEFWEWVWGITPDSSPRPFVGIWPRGGAKSTSAELACTALGLRGQRRYALYVRETQEQADNSVTNIATLLEAATVEGYYPAHAERAVSKFGNSRGWRRNRLRTAGGFTVDAIGLDTAARGVKVEEQRPDLIIFDDIDAKHDSAQTTAKKQATITNSLIPAGAENAAVLAIQNLIIPDGIFSKLADGRADFLAERIVSGPFPAIEGLEWEWEDDPETNTRRGVITGGVATWEGQNLHVCQRLMDRMGPAAFLMECQHDVSARQDGLALRFTDDAFADLTDEDVRTLCGMGRVFGGIDFGAWRFAFVLFAVDREGIPHAVAEYFSQREELSVRARAVHDLCAQFNVLAMRLWGDAANPTDIMELNAAFQRGWRDNTGKQVTSRLRVKPVAMENKMRKASVERINDLLERRAFRIRRTIGAGQTWQLGFNAASAGVPMTGSRLVWEMQHWGYPIPQEGVAQKQDPDDNTADGADAIAATRYAIMSWWKPAAQLEPEERSAFHPDVLQEDTEAQHKPLLRRKKQRSNRPLDPSFGAF